VCTRRRVPLRAVANPLCLTAAAFPSSVAQKYKDITFATNLAYVRYIDGTPYFYFVRDAFRESKF
jgi:hypothetical protein